ncbi:hypothetical protein [Microcystis phage Mwe-JY26]
MMQLLAALALLTQLGICQPAALTDTRTGEQRVMLVCDVIEPREEAPAPATPAPEERRT